jgi:glutamate dehydrogenase (NAD(P)+)
MAVSGRDRGAERVAHGSAPIEITLRGPDGSTLGAIAIDSTVAGRARGGLRISPRADGSEVRSLARAMTLKYGFLGLPQGGAKGAALGDPEGPLDERRRVLSAFARAAAPVLQSGLYLPDADVGTRNADIRGMLETAGVRPKRREWRGERSGFWTATTVLAALREAAVRTGPPLVGSRIAIEGFGAVGSALAALVVEAGSRVVAVSTSRGAVRDAEGLDVHRLQSAVAEVGSDFVRTFEGERLPIADLLELDVDYLCPCAVGGTIGPDNAARIRARAVVPGANDAIAAAAEAILHRRGIVCVPDFLANCGGVLGGTMEFAGVTSRTIRAFVDDEFGPRVGRVLDLAARDGVPTRVIAEPIAFAGHAAARKRAERPGLRSAAMGLALAIHRRGWIPAAMVGALAPQWFERTLAEVR